MKAGAFDYMVKAVEESRLVSGVRRAIEIRKLSRDYRRLKEGMLSPRLTHPEAFSRLVTRNGVMMSLFRIIESVAKSDEPILITGETGTGKGLMAAAVHAASGREGPLIEVNVAGLDDDHVLGHAVRSSARARITGAVDARGGLVQQAGSGTLFLDEIGDLSIQSQVKLLRLLDTGEYYPLGSDLPRRAAARILVATNHDLAALISEGKFRKDLYYRLSTHELRVPPLRDRKDDLPLLLDHFLERGVREAGKEEAFRAAAGPAAARDPRLSRQRPRASVDGVRLGVPAILRRPLPSRISRPAVQRETLRGGDESAPAMLSFPDKLPTLDQAAELLIEEALKRVQAATRASPRGCWASATRP